MRPSGRRIDRMMAIIAGLVAVFLWLVGYRRMRARGV